MQDIDAIGAKQHANVRSRCAEGKMRQWAITVLTASLLAACSGSGDESNANGDGDSAPAEVRSGAPVVSSSIDPAKAFAMCSSCHSTVPHENRIGPSLFGVFGRRAGSEPGYFYSEAMKNADRTWDEASLDAFMIKPRTDLPGNKMTFAGIGDPAKRKAIIDYLKTLK